MNDFWIITSVPLENVAARGLGHAGRFVATHVYGFSHPFYSASDAEMTMVYRQGIHFVLGLVLILLFSQVEGKTLRQFAIWLYGIGVVLLILVLMVGVIKREHNVGCM